MAPNALRVLVVDDHEVVRRGLCALLESEPDYEVCGEAANGVDAVRKSKQLTPDVAIIDVSMPRLNGLEAARRIRKTSPHTEIILLTMHESESLLRDALECGVRAYVLKSDAGRDLIAAVAAVRRGTPFFSGAISAMLAQAYVDTTEGNIPTRTAKGLTAREREIVQLLAEGHSNKEIAVLLELSVKTVETHRSNILRKLGLHSLPDLVRYAIRNQIIVA